MVGLIYLTVFGLYGILLFNMTPSQIPLESVRGRNVLLKVAYDLPSLEDTARIENTLDTLHYLLERNNRVLISTHWGRPDGFDLAYSTTQLMPILAKLYRRRFKEKLNVQPLDQYEYFEDGNVRRLRRVLNLFKGAVVMLENSRYHEAERSSDQAERNALAQQYALIADAVVNEAFPLRHRKEVTNTELTALLPTALGLSYQAELSALNKLRSPQKPFTIILGGAKLGTKLPLLEHLLPRVDYALLAGQSAFPFLKLQGEVDVRRTKVDESQQALVQKLHEQYSKKLVLPRDFRFDTDGVALDVGPETIKQFSEIIDKSQTVFWNGPLGRYEEAEFAEGTKQIAAHLAKLKDAYTVVGGGDTIANLTPARAAKISFLSMGGGATLDYLANL